VSPGGREHAGDQHIIDRRRLGLGAAGSWCIRFSASFRHYRVAAGHQVRIYECGDRAAASGVSQFVHVHVVTAC